MSNSNVTVKLDSRVFYGLVAVVAVIGIFGIGWWLGQYLQDGQAAAPQAANAPALDGGGIANTSNAVNITEGQMSVNPADAPVQADMSGGIASKPVSPDDVPIEAGQPRIWVDEVAETNFIYDFGQIPAGEPTEKDFIVKNVGEGMLVIESASASCGCTAALVADSELGPGEETTVRVSYDPRVNGEAGKFVSKQVRIKSNDPLVPLVEFTVQADVAAQ